MGGLLSRAGRVGSDPYYMNYEKAFDKLDGKCQKIKVCSSTTTTPPQSLSLVVLFTLPDAQDRRSKRSVSWIVRSKNSAMFLACIAAALAAVGVAYVSLIAVPPLLGSRSSGYSALPCLYREAAWPTASSRADQSKGGRDVLPQAAAVLDGVSGRPARLAILSALGAVPGACNARLKGRAPAQEAQRHQAEDD